MSATSMPEWLMELTELWERRDIAGFYEFKELFEKSIEKAQEDEKLNQKIYLIGLFHAVMSELYGKELADMVMKQVNHVYRDSLKGEKDSK